MNHRLAAIVAVGALPWSLVFAGQELTLVFAFGLVDPAPLYLTDIVTYTFVYTRGLPEYLFAWPVGTLLYALALGSTLSGHLFGREDRRVTAVLLVLVGLTQVSFALGLSRRANSVAFPLGLLLCVAVVWWFDWPAFRESLTFQTGR
ncbi:MAG: TIGR04206 family protein [Haloarculaceae archaeon]